MAIKKRDGNTRMKIILTLFTVAIIYGPNHGKRYSKSNKNLVYQLLSKIDRCGK